MNLLGKTAFLARALPVALAAIWGMAVFGHFSEARAAEFDLFSIDSNRWMSVDHYVDKNERFGQKIAPKEAPEPPKPAEEITATKPPEPQVFQVFQVPPQTELPKIVISRPLSPPVMPGVNLGYDVRVTSTAEEDEFPAISLLNSNFAAPDRPLNLPVMPGLGQDTRLADAPADELTPPDDLRWRTAQQAIQDQENGVKKQALNVRFSALPDSRIASVPGRPIIKPHTYSKFEKPQETAPVQQAQAKKKNPEVCAAITAYKQRQLAAIESDRQTLDALQKAIAELGLGEKLNFMTGSSSGLNSTPESSKN